jgi:hypothetical protein
MQPSPDARLADVLAALPPDFCRDLLAELGRLRMRGGGDVAVTLRIAPNGQMSGAMMRWFEARRRMGGGGAT